jgi:hypothetical protein
MSHELVNLTVPVGLNWNEHSLGSATVTLFLACAAARAGLAALVMRVEHGEVSQCGQQAAGQDDGLAANLVGQANRTR